MRPKLIHLVALAPILLFVICGFAAANTTTDPTDPSEGKRTQSAQPRPDHSQLSEREKWSLAREAFSQAQAEEKRKDNEAAAYYYEVTLELLGSLDMASIEIPTHRVLSFQRKVLQRYDQFLASIDNLPSTAGPVAVLESVTPKDEPEAEVELPEKKAEEIDPKPAAIQPNAPPLPGVPLDMNRQVAGQINFFMNKGRKVMLKWMERSAYMFPRLRPILQEEGIPEEVMYLAMIESGLNPKAYSYAHAAGVWQFIPSTGRIYGLNVDKVYDERLHIENATRAACRYLRKLHNQFGDWYLAFAAYNCGERRVEREIERSRTQDYWRLNRLPSQTRGYVPAYLATRAICEDPEKYGFPKRQAEIPFSCEEVYVSGPYNLTNVARAAGLDPVLVSELNPEFLSGVTPPGRAVMVRLPRKPADGFETTLASMPKSEIQVPTTKVHKVRAGETLASIARRYSTTASAIKALPENRKAKLNRLKAGQRIHVPGGKTVVTEESLATNATASRSSGAVESKTTKPAETKAKPATGSKTETNEIVYTVHRGETLSKISQQLGVSVEEICRQNKIKNPNKVVPGRKLRITVKSSEPVATDLASKQPAATTESAPELAAQTTSKKSGKSAPSRSLHTVQAGDTVWSIARTYGQDPYKIMSWNRLTRKSRIFPGQELIVNQ